MKKGTKMSDESRKRISQAKKGKPSTYKGKKTPIEVRQRQSASRIAYFKRLNPDYQFVPNPRDDRKWVRRERIKMYGGSHSTGEWENLKAQYDWTCPSCKRKEPEIKLTRDHVIAVSRGGSDNIENIQPLCNPCNAQKSTLSIRF